MAGQKPMSEDELALEFADRYLQGLVRKKRRPPDTIRAQGKETGRIFSFDVVRKAVICADCGWRKSWLTVRHKEPLPPCPNCWPGGRMMFPSAF